MLVYMLGATVLSAPGLAVAHAPNGSEALPRHPARSSTWC
jgi:hypothetical protein